MKVAIMLSFAVMILGLASDAYAEWSPCGGKEEALWSWAWAGELGEHVTTVSGSGGQRITEMRDLSGNGHHYFNNTGANQPAFQIGLSVNGYMTSLPIVAVDKYADGTQVYGQWMDQAATMSVAGPFYLAFAGMNTRSAGHRHLWGRTWHDLVRLDQGRDRVNVIINGNEHVLSDSGSIPKGPILLEVWRDANNEVHIWVNGKDVSLGNVTNSDTFSLTGIGWSGGGTGGWDDYAFEYVACDDLPKQQLRHEVREYLRTKWRLYGDGAVIVAPKPPADLKVD